METIDKQGSWCGFTLIEMSIVLVIIALIAGGILVGQDLIKSAGNRAFISQLEQYDTAVNTFKTKYNCLPGDCAEGETFFGICTPLGTCHGNGNGMITALTNGTEDVDNTNSLPNQRPWYIASVQSEGTLFWTHLNLSGLVANLSTIGNDAGGYALHYPELPNSHEWVTLAGWLGHHYYRTGMSDVVSSGYFYPCRYSFSPSDAFYIANKLGQPAFTTTATGGNGMPDAVIKGDHLIVVGGDPQCINLPPTSWPVGTDAGYYYPPASGSGGASSDVCVNTDTSPDSLNVANGKKLCNLMIKAGF